MQPSSAQNLRHNSLRPLQTPLKPAIMPLIIDLIPCSQNSKHTSLGGLVLDVGQEGQL